MGNRPPTPPSLRILIVDSYDASRIGLALMLGRAPTVAECLTVASDAGAVALAREHGPEVAVIDISERGPFAGTLASALREVSPGIRLVLTSRCARSAPAVVRATRASAFIPAGSSGGATIKAILAVAQRDKATLVQPASSSQLSDREHDVLALMAGGATNREIAAELHLSTEAIKKHASAIYRKLGVRNRTEASQRARARRAVHGQSRIQE
jgi:DNA-binding NarL/FixJ family response regulator